MYKIQRRRYESKRIVSCFVSFLSHHLFWAHIHPYRYSNYNGKSQKKNAHTHTITISKLAQSMSDDSVVSCLLMLLLVYYWFFSFKFSAKLNVRFVRAYKFFFGRHRCSMVGWCCLSPFPLIYFSSSFSSFCLVSLSLL